MSSRWSGSRIPRLPNVGCDSSVAQACPKGRDCLMHDRVHLTPHHACCDIGSVLQCTTFQSQPSRSVQLLMSMRKTLCGTDVQKISVFVSVWSVMTRFVRQISRRPKGVVPTPHHDCQAEHYTRTYGWHSRNAFGSSTTRPLSTARLMLTAQRRSKDSIILFESSC